MRTFGKMFLAFGLVGLMAAPAWAQGRGFGGGFGGGTMLLTNKGVQQELKVSDEQATKLNALAEESRAKQREEFQKLQDLSQDERREKMGQLAQTWNAEMLKNLGGILKPEQVKRFTQIQTQQAGVNAFSTPRVQEALKLTDDQKAKLRTLSDETIQSTREAAQGFQDDREGTMKKLADIRKQASEKAAALLTDSQKASWKELTGEPYEVKFEPRQQN